MKIRGEGMTLIASMPRSGDHFTRFLVEHMTGRRTLVPPTHLGDGALSQLGSSITPHPLLHVNQSLSAIAIKGQHVPRPGVGGPPPTSLLLLLRDPHESLATAFANATAYMELLAYYHAFQGPKALV